MAGPRSGERRDRSRAHRLRLSRKLNEGPLSGLAKPPCNDRHWRKAGKPGRIDEPLQRRGDDDRQLAKHEQN